MITDREFGFTYIINQNKYRIGLEVGVRGGTYSQLLLKRTNLELLYSLDIELFKHTEEILKVFGNRSIYKHGKSPECSIEFADESIDFIYTSITKYF